MAQCLVKHRENLIYGLLSFSQDMFDIYEQVK